MIAIVISAHTEWNAVKACYAVEQTDSTPFGETFSVDIQGETVGFFFEGWGKINAAASTQYVLDTYSPELIINLGTCGGFAGHARAGDIIVATKTLVYDIYERMFDPDAAIRAYTTELDVSWIHDLDEVRMIKSVLVSADRDLDPAEITRLHDNYQAIAGDWESGAIAHVCTCNHVPVVILRGVSDLVSIHSGEAYDSAEIFRQRATVIMTTLSKLLPRIVTMYRERIDD